MLGLYVLANCALPWYAMWKNKNLKPDPKRDTEKFAPWVRIDYDSWSYAMVPFTHFFFLIRYSCCLGALFTALILNWILCIGADIENIGETRKWLIVNTTCLCMRFFMPFFGCLSATTSRPKVDYSKWLGPDWKPHYEGASMIVSNHNSWNEVFNTFLFIRPMPGFIAKTSIKEVPSVGLIATAVGTLFMSR